MNIDFFDKLNELIHSDTEFWTATVIKSDGHTPARPGMKMIVESDGKITGTVGGGEIEKKVIDFIVENKPVDAGSLDYNLGSESVDAESTSMICGGIQTVFIEPNNMKPVLYIIGGGHCGNALSELAYKTGFRIKVLDNREDLAVLIRSKYTNVKIIEYNNITGSIEFSDDIYIVIMTHSHQYDEFVLERIVEKKYKYLGMIGSRKKVKVILDNLLKKGVEEDVVKNVFSPIGYDIGSHTPEEIAVSIMAQIIAVRYGKNPVNNNPLL